MPGRSFPASDNLSMPPSGNSPTQRSSAQVLNLTLREVAGLHKLDEMSNRLERSPVGWRHGGQHAIQLMIHCSDELAPGASELGSVQARRGAIEVRAPTAVGAPDSRYRAEITIWGTAS